MAPNHFILVQYSVKIVIDGNQRCKEQDDSERGGEGGGVGKKYQK